MMKAHGYPVYSGSIGFQLLVTSAASHWIIEIFRLVVWLVR